MQPLRSPIVETSGAYLLDAGSPESVTVAAGVSATLFDAVAAVAEIRRELALSDGASCLLSVLALGSADYRLSARLAGRGAKLEARACLAAAPGGKARAGVSAQVGGEGNSAVVKTLSLVGNAASADFDGSVCIVSGARRAEGRLDEESLFLDALGSARGIPALTVESGDVKAGHSARAERLSDARLFYLRSRGIPKDDARAMMLRDALHGLFSPFGAEACERLSAEAMAFALGK